MTLTPRMVLGAYGDGTFGLKTSTPGFDVTVLADDNDANKRSFNSQWMGLTNIAQIGIATAPNTGTIVTHSLGYIPFFEARIYDPVNNIVYDDYCAQFGFTQTNALIGTSITSSALTLLGRGTTLFAMYVIFGKQV